MNRTGVRIVATAGLMWLAVAIVSAQSSVAVSTRGNARVLGALQLTRQRDLAFGAVVPSGAVGTVTIAPNGNRTAAGGASLAGGTAFQSAQFRVIGQPNKSYTFSLPAGVVISSGANSMIVNTFKANRASPATLPNSGAHNLNIGARVNLGANQPAGTYANTFSVTVTYN